MVLGVVATLRSGEHAGFAVAIGAAALAVIAASDLPVLWHSQLAFAWHPAAERALVTVSFATAVGLAAAGVHRIRLDTPPAAARDHHEEATG